MTAPPQPLTLRLILPKERDDLAKLLSPYYAEVAPDAGLSADQKAGQMLNRRDVTAFWICTERGRVGFALVLNLPEGRRELSELCILPEFRRQGLGRSAASLILREFPGRWRMGISAASPSALPFWGTCLSLMPGLTLLHEGAPFTALQSKSYTFEITDPSYEQE